MSIYGTWFSLDDDVPLGPATLNSPIYYQGSHILPTDEDRRDGSVDVAAIPGFIQRDGRDLDDEDGETVWPWLRLSVNHETVVLDRKQVVGLHNTLTEWLKRCPDGER